MKCELCKKDIKNFIEKFNQLELENNRVNICEDCKDRFLKWQQGIFADMFPTKAIKKLKK